MNNKEVSNNTRERMSNRTVSNGSGNGRNGRANGRAFEPKSNYRRPAREDIYLSVVVPAYNEESRLPKTIENIGNYLSGRPYSYEIIAVNDGSKDGTAAAVEKMIGKVAKLKLIDNRVNHGKGYVVRQGMLAARGQVRLFTDSDNSTPIEEVEKLLPFFKEGFDVVIGSRHASGARLEPAQPPIRQFLGFGWRMLTNITVGTWSIKDTQCGFKAMTAKAAQDILPRCRIDRFAFDPEILVLASSLKYRVKEVGILWKNDLRSTVKVSSMVKMFQDLMRIRLNQLKGLYGKKK